VVRESVRASRRSSVDGKVNVQVQLRLSALLQTPCIQYLHQDKYHSANGLVVPDPNMHYRPRDVVYAAPNWHPILSVSACRTLRTTDSHQNWAQDQPVPR
jgi:hypothetical protein